jgi:hypothetical protein
VYQRDNVHLVSGRQEPKQVIGPYPITPVWGVR